MRVFVAHESAFEVVVFSFEGGVFFYELLDCLAVLAGVGCGAGHCVVSFCWGLFVEDYDVDALSDVFFGASYFGAVANRCDFAFKEALYVVDC